MKKAYKKWRGQEISNTEHEQGSTFLKPKQKQWLEIILEGTDLCPRYRMHGNIPDFPCIYVFRNHILAREKRGLIFYIGRPKRSSDLIHIVFRKFEKQPPLPENFWNSLEPDPVQKHLHETQRGFDISSDRDALAAQSLVRACVSVFDTIYGESQMISKPGKSLSRTLKPKVNNADFHFDIQATRLEALKVVEKVNVHLNKVTPDWEWAYGLFEIIEQHPVRFRLHEYKKPQNRDNINHLFYEFIGRIQHSRTPAETIKVMEDFAPVEGSRDFWFMRAQSISYIVHCMKPTHCFAFNSPMHRTLLIYGIDWIRGNMNNERRFKAYLRLLSIMLQSENTQTDTFFIDFTIKLSPLELAKTKIWEPLVQNPEDGRQYMRENYLDANDEAFMKKLSREYNQGQIRVVPARRKLARSSHATKTPEKIAPAHFQQNPPVEKQEKAPVKSVKYTPDIVSLDLPDSIPDDFKKVFEHIATFGAITEQTLAVKLGGGRRGARKSRRFSNNLQKWLTHLPFDIEITSTQGEGNEFRKKPWKGDTHDLK